VITVARTLGDEHVVLTLAFDADADGSADPAVATAASRFDTRDPDWSPHHDGEGEPRWWATVHVS
jgi:hypothetical protein